MSRPLSLLLLLLLVVTVLSSSHASPHARPPSREARALLDSSPPSSSSEVSDLADDEDLDEEHLDDDSPLELLETEAKLDALRRRRRRKAHRRRGRSKRRSECEQPQYGSVIHKADESGKERYTFHAHCTREPFRNAVAWGYYADRVDEVGWGELSLRTSGKHKDLEQAYAAGLLEGAMTHSRVYQMHQVVTRHSVHQKVRDFLATQDQFLRGKVDAAKETDEDAGYWYNVALVLNQLDGLLDGYNQHRSGDEPELTLPDLWLIQSDVDDADVERASSGRHFKKVSDMTKMELIELVSLHGHCSAIVKWTGDDLLVGHTSWDDYSELLRMYKHYRFAFQHSSVKSQRSSHSSYPGFIFSSDDFYVLDSGLVVTETTINILNEELYRHVDPSSTIMAWVRNLVANRMAGSAREWCHVFRKHNSGTENNQWLVVDYNKFNEGGGTDVPAHTLYVLEQIPGFVEIKDMSHVLKHDTYWASFNRPYFESINEKSMYKHFSKVHGEMFTYRHCARAKIFQRDHKNVKSIADLKTLMRQNRWQTDPLSKGCPGNAIAARFDLKAPRCRMSRVANGATDAKVIKSAWVKHLRSEAIAGPTTDDQPPFSWEDPMFSKEMHVGQPTRWQYDWIEQRPHHL